MTPLETEIQEIIRHCSMMYGWYGGNADPEPDALNAIVRATLNFLDVHYGFHLESEAVEP